MYTFNVLVRINQYQTANIQVQAANSWEAKLLVEAQYGANTVLQYSQV